VVPAIERLTAAIRRAGVPVIWLNWGVRADRANLPPLTLAKGRAGGTPTYGEHSPSGRGRVLVRPSGTEPLVRIMIEAPTAEAATAYTDRLATALTAALGAP